MKISLLGYMGSGKSTIGQLISDSLQLNFLDLDELIEENQKKSIHQIFTESGQIKFRKLEKQILDEVLATQDNFVLALGGGTPAYYDNMDFITKHTQSIYLRADIGSLLERLKNQRNNRPLLSHLDPDELPEFLGKHLFERRVFYERADFVVDIKNKTVEQITEEIINLLHQK